MSTDVGDRNDLSVVRDALLAIGYEPNAIISDYDFATTNGHMSRECVDLVAFSDPVRHDLQTSCIAAHKATTDLNVPELLQKLSFLAVPLAIIVRSDCIELWPVKTKESPKQLQQLQHDQLTPFFLDHRQDFNPDALKAAKDRGLQLSFLDLDPSLVEFAYKATRQILVSRFEAAVRETRDNMISRQGKKVADIGLTKVALQLLAAAILEDKKILGGSRSQSAIQLLQKASSNFSQYFDMSIATQIGDQNIEMMHMLLRHDITFRSFTNEMLGYFYENTFVDSKLRKELGIYYTPASIAKQILARLPIEDISPPERIVFDGSCGSGNLLLAAYERLAGLLPKLWSKEDTHNYLVERIHGMDLDQFASQVARLSLFLIGLPSGDAWDIEVADFTASNKGAFSPTILIGNPPFQELRSWEGKRFQRASLFLERYLDLLPPYGLLGIVLPETFLENSSCREARRRLLRECDLLEMWHLPEGIFPMSNAATVVVLAKKLSIDQATGAQLPVRIRRVFSLRSDKRRFLEHGAATYSYVVPSTGEWLSDKHAKISSSILDELVWKIIKPIQLLGDIADVRNGIIPGPVAQTRDFSDKLLGNDWKPWLGGASRIEPYFIKPEDAKLEDVEAEDVKPKKKYVRYPGTLLWPRLDLEPAFNTHFAKVLMNSGRAPGNPWRVYATIDEYGYFPSQSFHCITPQGDITLSELVAFLNSPIASAWIDSKNRRRWIDEKVVRDMPFPCFSGEQRENIKELVAQIMNLKKQIYETTTYGATSKVKGLVQLVDTIVYDAFELPSDAREALQKFFKEYQRPGIEWKDFKLSSEEPEGDQSSSRNWTVTGQVVAVHPDEGKVTLWVRGYNRDQSFKIDVPDTMPGWALREDSAFQALLPSSLQGDETFETSALHDFRPVDFSFLSSDELARLFEDTGNFNRLYKSKGEYGR